jgi:hypothetical protein
MRPPGVRGLAEQRDGVLAQPCAGGPTRLGPRTGNRSIFLLSAGAGVGAAEQHVGDQKHLFGLPSVADGVLPEFEVTVQNHHDHVNSESEKFFNRSSKGAFAPKKVDFTRSVAI